MAEPVRTCVGCRRRSAKRDMMRVAVGSHGLIDLDATGRAPGRGAYLHRAHTCIETAVGRNALARALRAGSDAGGAARLLEVLRTAASASGIAAAPPVPAAADEQERR